MPTYKLIASSTVGAGGASSITFSSIPQTYTDLVLLWSTRKTTNGAAATYISFNSSTSSFSAIYLYAQGTGSVVSGTLARYIGSVPGADSTANCFSNSLVYIPNYTSSNNKSYSADNVDDINAAGNDMNFIAGLWSNTAAITSLSISPAADSFTQYSTAYLYGISNA